jgi:hypothetical protein
MTTDERVRLTAKVHQVHMMQPLGASMPGWQDAFWQDIVEGYSSAATDHLVVHRPLLLGPSASPGDVASADHGVARCKQPGNAKLNILPLTDD